jgi:hypothetical protein
MGKKELQVSFNYIDISDKLYSIQFVERNNFLWK